MTVGENIKKFRKEKGLTQEELGKAAGLSGVAIMRYEKEQRTPSQKTLIQIAKALNVHLRELVDNSIFEEFDEKYPNLGQGIKDFEQFEGFLKSAGYESSYEVTKWHWEDENEKDPSKRVQISDEMEAVLSKDGYTATFTEQEFNDLQESVKNGAKETLERLFYKRALEQQQNKK